jgi:succinate dehydrogenase / fumarate reductase membrane anchor subunit
MAKVRGLGSARAGTQSFWHQRLTGLLLVPLSIAFVWVLLAAQHHDYDTVRALVAHPVVSILMLLFVLSGAYHMRIGVQVIIEDYIHREATKIVALVLNNMFSLVVGLACVYAVLKIGFT